MKESDIRKEIELTLSSIDGLEKAKAPGGFMESLTGKMIFQEDQLVWVQRAKYAIAVMIAFAILNTMLLINSNVSNRTEMLESVASEWNQTTNDY